MPLSENELAVLERALANPKAKRKIANAVKEVVPELDLPADVKAMEDIEELIEQKTKGYREEIDNLRGELAKATKNDDWAKQLSQLKKERGWNDKQVDAFLKDLEEEFKDRKELSLSELAEYHALKNQPLTPTQSGNMFGFGGRGDAEKTWREDVKDPNSDFMKAVRAKDKNKKKAYLNKRWNDARQEWVDEGNKAHF